MAQQFPYQFKNPDQKLVMDQPAVYKLHFGQKYFIWKGKTLRGSLELNATDIRKMLWGTPNPAHAFAPVIAYIKKARILKIEVEVIIQTDDLKQLLKKENELLAIGSKDAACLNTIYQAHIPKWLAEALNPVKAAPIGPVPVTDKVKEPTLNKALKTTFDQPVDKVPVTKPVKSTTAIKMAPGKLNKLQQAFQKLNK